MEEKPGIPLSSEQIFPNELPQIEEWLSGILRDEAKRKALLELRGPCAQSWIDGFNYFVSDPEIRQLVKPWLLKHTVIILRKLCEVSMLYPTCYVLSGIRDISPKNGGGFCDISQGRFKEQLLCLKIVRLYQDSNIEQLLKANAREAILWNQLDHPNIVPFYGIFYLDGKERICLVSPWMENGDIVHYLQRVPEAPRKPFVDDIANGLQYLHAENIVHGDLKGRNVLIDDRQRACLADFGLSTISTNETLGFARTTVGSPGCTTRWASPELLEEDAGPTRESDVWAFGCLCYEVLTGFEPFMGFSDIRVIVKLLRGELPAQLDDVTLHSNEHLDKKLRELIGSCWSTEVEQRPRCPEILQQLEVDSFARQSGGHPPKAQNRFWFSVPEATSNLSRLRDLLEQLYHGNEVDVIRDTKDPQGKLEFEDQTRRMQKDRETQEEIKALGERPHHLEEGRQQVNEEPKSAEELHERQENEEQERIRIAKEAERDERFKLEQRHMQQMEYELRERVRIAEEAERRFKQQRKSAWIQMRTKDRIIILKERERDERFKQEQNRLRQQKEYQRADSTTNPDSWGLPRRPSGRRISTARSPSSGISVWDYAKAASAGSIASSDSASTSHVFWSPFFVPNIGTAKSKRIDEQIQSASENLQSENN